jgi:hypothetical protein
MGNGGIVEARKVFSQQTPPAKRGTRVATSRVLGQQSTWIPCSAPPVYRPLGQRAQTKLVPGHSSAPLVPWPTVAATQQKPVAVSGGQPVYRPQAPEIQTKAAHIPGCAPPVYRPLGPPVQRELAARGKAANPVMHSPNFALESRPAPSVYRPFSGQTLAQNPQFSGGTGTLQRTHATPGSLVTQYVTQQKFQTLPAYEPYNRAVAPRRAASPPACRLNPGLAPGPAPPVYGPRNGSAVLLPKPTAFKIAEPKNTNLNMPAPRKVEVIQRSSAEVLTVEDLSDLVQKGAVIKPPGVETLDELIADLQLQNAEREQAEQIAALDRQMAEIDRATKGLLAAARKVPPRTANPGKDEDAGQWAELDRQMAEIDRKTKALSAGATQNQAPSQPTRSTPATTLPSTAPQTNPASAPAQNAGWDVPYMAENLLSAHGAGYSTGPVSILGVAANFASSPFGPNPTNVPSQVGYTGSVANFVSGAGDIAGIVRASLTLHDARQVLASGATDAQKQLAWAQIKSAAADMVTQFTDLSGQMAGLASTFAASGSQVATNTLVTAPFISTAVGSAVATRSIRRAALADRYRKELDKVLTSIPASGKYNELWNAAKFVRNQMAKRQFSQVAGALGAIAGAGGGVALGIGAVAAAAGTAAVMATPVGWGLAAAAGIVALSIGAYKGYRYIRKVRKHGPDQGKGEKRKKHAAALIAALHSSDLNIVRLAQDIISARGLTPAVLMGTGGQQLLEEKLKSW